MTYGVALDAIIVALVLGLVASIATFIIFWRYTP